MSVNESKESERVSPVKTESKPKASENPQKPDTPKPTALQSTAPQYMPMPNVPIPANCPPGLEYLLSLDQLLITQQIHLLELFTRFEVNNAYDIQNILGQKAFFVAEDTEFMVRTCCKADRPFEIRIFNLFHKEVMHLSRPLRCDMCCCCCCLQYMRVEAPPGNIIGKVVQDWHCMKPLFRVEDASGATILRIEGPIFTSSICFNDVEFMVLAKDQDIQIGKITKKWSGVIREYMTNADIFGVKFPMNLDIKSKALLMAATFLIDFMYYEQQPDHHHRHRRHHDW